MSGLRVRAWGVLLAAAVLSSIAGCAVVGVAATAASLAVGAVTTAGEVVVGAGKLTVKAVGAGIDAVTPSRAAAPPAPPR